MQPSTGRSPSSSTTAPDASAALTPSPREERLTYAEWQARRQHFESLTNPTAVKRGDDGQLIALGRTAGELLSEVPEQPNWLVPGIAAKGWTVKLAAREKTGKGLFVVQGLLGPLERRESTIFGDASERRSHTALIVTEEPDDSIREKVALAGLKRARIIHGHEINRHFPKWQDKAKYAVDLAGEQGHSLVFWDNISRATGAEDEAGVELARAVEYLSDLTSAAGLTSLIDHHHKKGGSRIADKSRGGTALAGAVENNIELVKAAGGEWTSRVRKLYSSGRVMATIWEKTIRLSDDGSCYELVADSDEPQSREDRARLEELQRYPQGVTCKDYGSATGLSADQARRVLEDFVARDWATVDTSARAHRWAPAAAEPRI